ncbi:caspase family protein [Hyphomicrobium sp.]|uniref:caspase family protein n=1 Tax=Hyphomicrobium sp. TaxID=82 RepID=UPI0025BBE175|nr:caspase family protein [Hyphomicrobium sp.]MCC7251067.1 caspase family protein [Hyphomicrobium sp.]
MSKLRFFALVFLVLFVGCLSANPPLAQPGATTCHLRDGSLSGPMPQLSVAIKQPEQPIRTGAPIAVEWKLAGELNPACRAPLYLVLSTTARSRFEGEKFLAFPPGAPGPYAIAYELARTRVFVPLHLGPGQASGNALIKVYQAGPLTLDWALVEVSKLKADAKTAKDFAFGQEWVGSVTRLGDELNVIGGNPEIVIRDRFTTEAPQKTIRSNSGEFELQVFDKFYRVLDSKTGELLQERNGWDPNFSPSSRFLGAFADGPGFEIIDLYSGTVVTSEAELRRNRGYRGRVHLAAWSTGDAVFALSIWGWAGIELQQALVDGSQRSFTDTGCHACQGVETALVLDFEGAITTWGNGGQIFGDGWESLLDHSIGTSAVEAASFEQIPPQADEPSEVWEKRRTLQAELSARAFARVSSAAFFDSGQLGDSCAIEASDRIKWCLDGPLLLSHHCALDTNGVCGAHTADEEAWKRELAELAALRLVHKGPPAAPAPQQLVAEARLATTRGGFAMHRSDKRAGPSAEDAQSSVWSRLQQLDLTVNGEGPLKPAVELIDWEKAYDHPDQVIAPIIASIPSAAKRLPIRETGGDVDPEYSGHDSEATLIDPTWIRQLATFSVGERTYWLIHSYYSQGASSRNFFALLHGTKTGPSEMADLASRLKYSVGSQPSGLSPDGTLEYTDERGTTMGFGGWPSDFDKVTVAFDRYLILTGHWLGANLRWVLLFDLKSDQILLFNRDIPAATNLDEFGVTADGRTLVQYNAGGQLHFYDVASGAIVLRGFHIDDELIVYDPRGYYSASPEGSQFIFLKFPGLPGYNSLQQFARTLKRPALIKAVLAGNAQTPDPLLTPPPTLHLAAEVTGASAQRTAKLRIVANSAMGLEKTRIFIDGQLAGEHAMSGRSADLDITLPLKPEARWVTVVAVDAVGYESVAQGAPLAGAGKPVDSRLFAISIGTDRYDDNKHIAQLKLAKTDARNFAKSVEGLKGRTYADVEVTSFLDAEGLRGALLAKLRQLTAATQPSDTIMLFAAGHGFRDVKTGQFYLATRETRLADLAATSISWEDIAKALDGTKARLIVLLDACHSGAADGGANDDAVSSLIKSGTSMTVLAAAKGRQSSYEDQHAGGGQFTTALVRAITTGRKGTDSNSNGAIELAEVYGAVKKQVVAATVGRQTPWIARNLMVGEIPVF